MNTLPLDLYKVIEGGLGGQTWQEFVDHYNEKYDTVQIDGFEFEPTRLDYTFSQLITSLNAKTLPAYVDPDSPGYETALRQIEGKTGNIPTQKKFYRLDRVAVRQQLQLMQKVSLTSLTPEMQNIFMQLIDEGTDGLIGSYYNALTNQRMQVVSTGKFTIDTTNNPRGLKGITIDFNVPTANKDNISGTARWWTTAEHVTTNEGTTADPIKYMADRVKYIRRKGHYSGGLKLEISDTLWTDLLTHSKVVGTLAKVAYPNATDATTTAAYMLDEQKKDLIRRLIRVDEIVVRDSFAFVDKIGEDADGNPDIVTETVENFSVTNIAFVPTGKIGGIQGVEPLTLGYDADKVASYNDGRLKLTQRVEPKTHSLYIESEAAQLCVPSVPQFMFISTVTV